MINKKNMKHLFILFICSVCLHAVKAQDHVYPFQNPNLSDKERAADLCSRLTIEEKSKLLKYHAPDAWPLSTALWHQFGRP